MISIVITAYKEPKTISKAIKSFLNQDIKEDYELFVCAPDDETLNEAKKYYIKTFKDPGKGKTYALNMILPKLKGDVIVLTDGDVYVSNNSVNDLVAPFKDKKVGCVTGRPLSLNSREDMFGYWSHLLCYAAHRLRLKRYNKNEFLECSGYLWSFRNNVICGIPRETAEDTIVPCMFYLKGYRIAYVPEAKVYVKFPNNMDEFIKQKTRTAGGHETLGRYVDLSKIPRMKNLKNEILGSYILFSYFKNFKELLYTLNLFPLRFYIWMNTYFNVHIKRDKKVDGWKPLESTK